MSSPLEITVRGTPTTRFRFTISAARLGLGAGDAPAFAWIDSEGRLRRFRMSFELPSGQLPVAGAKVAITLETCDFGVGETCPGGKADPVPDPVAVTPGMPLALRGGNSLDPLAWAFSARTAPDVARVLVTFDDGTSDEMAPVDGFVLLAGRAQPSRFEAFDSGAALVWSRQ